MSKNNRKYKRGEPFRNSTLFVIACEGEVRERDYFNYFGKISRRIRTVILETVNGESSPARVRERALKYEEEIGLSTDDQLWFVVDVDRWGEDILRDIDSDCKLTPNWHIAISNPCFEVWLFLHKWEINQLTATSCQECKRAINDKIPGGYQLKAFLSDIHFAVQRARQIDSTPNHYMPDLLSTKVYLLIEEIFTFLGTTEVIRCFGHPPSI